MAATAVSTNESTGLVKGAGIVSLALAVIAPLVGLVTSIAVFFWARSSGASTKLAIFGIIISLVMLVISFIVLMMVVSLISNAASLGAINMEALCGHRDTWGWLIDSLRYVCR